jgi:hypothetical protein
VGKERRLHERVEPGPGEAIDVQIMGADFLERMHAMDISVGGLAIRVPHGFAGYDVKDRVQLVVKLPGEKSFLAEGFIRHLSGSKSPVFGVEFTALSAPARATIEAYIARRRRPPP